MTKYELVCVIDAGVSSADITALKTKIEQMVTVVETDDMGLLPTAYPIRGQDQAYYVSYLVEVDPTSLDAIKQRMKLENGLVRYVFYTMSDSQSFLKYADLKAQYLDLVSQEGEEEEVVSEDVEMEADQQEAQLEQESA